MLLRATIIVTGLLPINLRRNVEMYGPKTAMSDVIALNHVVSISDAEGQFAFQYGIAGDVKPIAKPKLNGPNIMMSA